jgi:parvulin-like peptidyl-prolyl isomerase
MRTIILFVLTLFAGFAAQAQSTTASLNITLTDVQSVTFGIAALDGSALASHERPKDSNLQVLSRSTSQIKQINSQNSEYEKLYKEFYSGLRSIISTFAESDVQQIAGSNAISKPPGSKISNLVIYQIDPR